MAKYNPSSDPGLYTSAYLNQIANARAQLMDYKYNPVNDANYQALAKVYGARGNQAAADTLGQAAALNNGMQTSYAVSAAQQARNQYNQELAAMIPELERNSYSRLQDKYNMLMDADPTAYQQYRDKIADYQWAMEYELSKKGSSGGGGGGRRSGGSRSGGGGYYSSGGGNNTTDLYAKAQQEANKKKKSSGTKTLTAGKTASPQVNKLVRMTQ